MERGLPLQPLGLPKNKLSSPSDVALGWTARVAALLLVLLDSALLPGVIGLGCNGGLGLGPVCWGGHFAACFPPWREQNVSLFQQGRPTISTTPNKGAARRLTALTTQKRWPTPGGPARCWVRLRRAWHPAGSGLPAAGRGPGTSLDTHAVMGTGLLLVHPAQPPPLHTKFRGIWQMLGWVVLWTVVFVGCPE